MATTINSARKHETVTNYEHTPQIFERRRSLFPQETVNSEEDFDLGHMSPLSFDSDFDHEDVKYLVTKQRTEDNSLVSKTDTIGDYDILGIVENEQVLLCTPLNGKYCTSEAMSPLYLSPYYSQLKHVSGCPVNETPSKTSPSYKLQTPHDTSTTISKLPKLIRKSLLDESETPSNKRKLSPSNSPEKNKHIKLDPKNSKVRTTLFPEVDISLPTLRFYPKTVNTMDKVLRYRNDPSFKSVTSVSTSRKSKSRKRPGEINAGVGHKIRKPKPKKTVKKTMNTLSSAAITDFLQDLMQLRASTTAPVNLIENKENSHITIPEEVLTTPPQLIEKHEKLPCTEVTKKRPLNAESNEPDPKKKFFKYSRAKGIVTVNKNIKLAVDHGKMTLVDNKTNNSSDIELVTNEFPEEESICQSSIDKILTSLEDEDKIPSKNDCNKIVLQANSSVMSSENSILLHEQPKYCPANLILSPISQMCDVTSGLALNSPKRAKNLTSVLDRMPNASSHVFNESTTINGENEKQMFPIFYAGASGIPDKKEDRAATGDVKKFKKLSESQMLLDAGQKKFGYTQCYECNFVYHMGDPNEEMIHLNYHSAAHVVRFWGWKNERVVADFYLQGRIIQIVPGDSKFWWKRAKDLMELINQELGCYDMEFNIDGCQVFLYIKNRAIVGCVVAIAKQQGHRMLSTNDNEADICSETLHPIKCGVARIWVSRNYRKQGIATALMDTLKKSFILGNVLTNSDIAFSSPTDMGKCFAKKYFQTSNYLIYFV